MHESNLLPVIGTFIEMIGLAFLFEDLLTSKQLASELDALRNLQDNLATSTTDLVMNMNTGLSNLSKFIVGYLKILEMEAKDKENPPKLEEMRLPSDTKKVLLDGFQDAQERLAPEATIKRGLDANAQVKAKIAESYTRTVAISDRLRKVAKSGVFLVALGTLMEFAGFFFDLRL